MKKAFFYFILIALMVLLIIIGGNVFPKYAGRLIVFGGFLTIDILYWQAFGKFTVRRKRFMRQLLNAGYWLPLVLFLLFLVFSTIWPIQTWIPFFRIYFSGILIPLFLWKIMLFVFLVIGELVALPVNLRLLLISLRNRTKVDWKRFNIFISLGLILGSFLSLLIFSGFFFWVYDFKLTPVTIEVEDLPAEFDGFRIVQLSDIHLGSWISEKPLDRAIRMVNGQKPDLIVFTGDMVNYITGEAYPFEDILRQMKAPWGIYCILGNHDYGDYVKFENQAAKDRNDKDLQSFYKKLGWHLMKNSNSILYQGADSIALLGVENWSSKKIWGQRGDLRKALSGAETVPFKILLSHDPTQWASEVLPEYPDIKLTLSGHTHGMQLGWEIGRCRFSPAQWLFAEWAGLYRQKGRFGNPRYLYINRGLGHLGFPGRVGIRPEITLIVLRKK